VVKNLDFNLPIIERVLGVQWNVASDTFSFSITIKDRLATRRGLLSVISSVYDPLRFVAPFVPPEYSYKTCAKESLTGTTLYHKKI